MIGWIEPRTDGRRLALELVGRLARSGPGRSSRRARVLVIRPDHLGDLLMLTPALAELRQSLPGAEIVGLIGPWGRPVLATNPHLDRLLTWEFPWFDRRRRRSALGPYRSLISLARALRREKLDLAIQFRADFWWGALAVRLAGIPERLGYDVPSVRPFLTRAVPLVHGLHAADENRRLVSELVGAATEPARTPRPSARAGHGVKPEPEHPSRAGKEAGGFGPAPSGLEFYPTSEDRQRANELLGPRDGRPLIGLQTGAGATVKRWPLERLADVGRALVASRGARLIVVGGFGEEDLVRRVVDLAGGDALPLAGQTSLGELGAVWQRCAVVIGPDSGPLHLAVAVGTPTVHLFGPADPRRFGPYGDPERHRVIRSPWPCAPCNQLSFTADEAPRHRCMEWIGRDPVIAAASELLDHHRG